MPTMQPTMQPTTLTFLADTWPHEFLWVLAEDEDADPGERLRALQHLGVTRGVALAAFPRVNALFSRAREAGFAAVLAASADLAAEECFDVLLHTSKSFALAVATWDVAMVEVARESALRAFAVGLAVSDEPLDDAVHVGWLLAEAGFVATPELARSLRDLAEAHREGEEGFAAGEGLRNDELEW